MRARWLAMIACSGALAVAACADADNDEGMTADTAVVPGTETVDVQQTVPTTDTVVTTTETETDTIEGDADGDTIRR